MTDDPLRKDDIVSLTDFGDTDGLYQINHLVPDDMCGASRTVSLRPLPEYESPARPHASDDSLALVEGTPKGSTAPYSERPDYREEWRL